MCRFCLHADGGLGRKYRHPCSRDKGIRNTAIVRQVIGRGLRRQSYDVNEDGLLDVEYADVFGIPSTSPPMPSQ